MSHSVIGANDHIHRIVGASIESFLLLDIKRLKKGLKMRKHGIPSLQFVAIAEKRMSHVYPMIINL